MVVHRLNDADVAALRALGIRHVRCSLYGTLDGADVIDRALAEGFGVLAVTYRPQSEFDSDAARWPTVLWQQGNEPDWRIISAVQVATTSGQGSVSPGLDNGCPATWVKAYADAARGAQIIALHAYGDVLADAIRGRQAVAATTERTVWLTEIGHTDASYLAQGLRAVTLPRVYVYALWSDADGYTLTDAHRQVIADFIAGRP